MYLSLNSKLEIDKLVNALSEFSPTIIVIERPTKMQAQIDSLYKLYHRLF